MFSNVFSLTHTQLEKADHCEGKSHLNPYEADIALALARHLMMLGYSASQITILTTYSGQLLHFRKLRRMPMSLQAVRISVVDNFQGEEQVTFHVHDERFKKRRRAHNYPLPRAK